MNKEWFRAIRGFHRGRLRRSAAAAAAVTLAAGMTAAPAVAAVPDPSSGNQPPAGSPREGVQVAQNGGFARPAPRPGPAPIPPEQQSPYGPAQPGRPGRAPRAPEVGPPQPEGLIQLTPGAENLLRAAEDVNNYKEFTQEQEDAALALSRLRQQLMDTPIARSFPEAEFFESVPPGPRNEGPSLLPGDQRQAISRQLARDGLTEPVGYLNPYETWRALGPADEADSRLAGDRQWLGDQLQASKLPADTRNAYQEALNDTLSRINQAETQDQRNALIDQFNALKDDFNRAEMGYRDDNNLYGEEGRQVPRALDPGLPEPAPESLRDARAAFEAAEQQEALEAAQEYALEPGVMTGGDVNTGAPDTDPGPVGGDPAEAQAAARENALTPGMMNGGGVNTGTPDTDPGPVGGNGQDAPSAGTRSAIGQGRSTETGPDPANGTPEAATGDSGTSSPDGAGTSGVDSQNGTDTSSETDAGAAQSSSESQSATDSDSGGGSSDSSDSGSYGGGSTSYGGSDSSSDSSSSGDGGSSSSSGGDGGSSSSSGGE
ncbi:hypothetical protein Amsp01_079010 [Amycolatopsis sp. NBRC 101858]|uniref:hypothetical protein n=1 Tax=Amycolatopsis sp. NBRC 101858 TaxID=3032200 RepID=UPI0024A0D383|nr:hypothetical protein [Amycolatopsis sp. NBRC 101858]GLY41878.1 hypothetical protein Amsp01_079010 [Amycolatopsis sp. NBRC 101858]